MTARPAGLGPIDTFRYFMPGHPPTAPTDSEGCWDWAGPTDHHGYGLYECRNKRHRGLFLAHRVSWAIFNGESLPPPEVKIRHTCDRPICVQPAHLLPGTQADNVADMNRRGRQRWGELRGEQHGNAKLTAGAVLAIRASALTSRRLARLYGVSEETVRRVRNRKGWSWLA